MKNSLYSVLIAGVFLLAGCAKDGDPGPSGSNGVNGQQGKDGEKGAQGVQGTPGVTGLQGPKGDTGVGPQGIQGPAGNTILYGIATPPPPTLGANGDFYINTATNFIYGPKDAGTWPAGKSIVGAAGSNGTNGTNGTNGNSILYGTAAPTTEGVNGDFYINTSTNFIYGPKAAGTWPAGTSLVGPQGQQGIQGPAGGPQGPAGTNGTNGTNGTDANVKVFFFDNQPGSAWTGTIVGIDSSAKWTLSLNNAAFTQAFKDTAGVFIYKKGVDGVSRVLPLINGQKQETFEMPSGNTNIDVVVNRFDDKAFERPSVASYRVVLAYKSFIKLHPEIDWNSERSVMAALLPRNGN